MQSPDVMMLLIQVGTTTLVGLVGFLLVHALNRLNRTLDRASERLEDHEQRIAHLEGFQEGYGIGKRRMTK